jgi:hypothetical protein
VRQGHWKTLPFIAALRHDRINAPWTIDGPFNGDIIAAYVQKVLVPALAKGDIVILDNLGTYKGKEARKAIDMLELTSSSCLPPAPIPIRSSKSSPSSSTSCETHRNEPSKTHGERPTRSSTSSRRGNAQTISPTPTKRL